MKLVLYVQSHVVNVILVLQSLRRTHSQHHVRPSPSLRLFVCNDSARRAARGLCLFNALTDLKPLLFGILGLSGRNDAVTTLLL